MVIGDLESVEKIIPQQRPLRVTCWAAPADTASAGADWLVAPKGCCSGMIFSAESRSPINTLLRKIDKPFGLFCFG